ncbi:MAG: hypothetical protein QM706_05040 [Nitrospira sp.]
MRHWAGIRSARWAVSGLLLLAGLGLPGAQAADDAVPPAAAGVPAATPIEQALRDITSEEAAVRSQAAAVLIEQGDARLLPTLDAIRAKADRTGSGWRSSRSSIC